LNILMLVWSDVGADARVQREAGTLADAGHHVHIIGRAVSASYQPPRNVSISSAGRAPTQDVTSRPKSAPFRVARWLLLPTHVRRRIAKWAVEATDDARTRTFDVVHAHDFSALAPGATLARERGVPLIYDAHEFWSGRPRLSRPAPLRRRLDEQLEGRLGAQASVVLTVGPGLAELLRDRFHWTNVQVVRNTFPMPPADEPPLPGPPTGAVYAGRIAAYRELETVIAAAERLPSFRVTLVGPVDAAYAADLRTGPVRVLPSAPLDEAVRLMREVGVALVTHSNRWINHRLALPNKLFLAVQAGVPVVATDVPELRRVVTEHGLGVLYPPGDAVGLAAAVGHVIENYPTFSRQVVAARPALSWDADKAALLAAYTSVESRL
jgi:glycosyltransferase involved in cell wall biosynthesis